ncbi:hypothetical protein A2276_03035 [candidate division WOR-1 bacterium RIFOXYA12_FULL_43_27]|uniref:RND transporter n=1 Tax=candidate division WOR-1 bacterium RIFOXYC2_FULL_46_14 TaxID=1802587 RepID=A0A1F4U7N9_UNCSA|nr:MAG: hypothetical protein A2276_03035 [candidate division WOR-1 bacterium RIFOXYA12_FULL_43_27]OGC19322.1 MAG: hypothetical protein A2292_01300 [candidate division WOR-1 bacterium RIFOXYB2_FULL_46_45]OGC30311.1 MAG: hypothetical protein A2232_01300 [candidate division WOR-1 bacterium RIFOXYA2_FULL_46_56]OGC40912.1 MAG: hypothetical protein A2438_01300 [candidate division WOR-1 bacterium RIFOXYC2_FULL_46_14]
MKQVLSIKYKVLTILVLSTVALSCAPKKGEKYETVKIERGSINSVISATGIVEPHNRLEIKPSVAGRIESVLVEEGEKVKKGQILAWMSSTERATLLDAARAQGEEEMKYWEELYRPTPITAPLNGFIIKRDAEPGQSVTQNDASLTMADRLMVKAQVDETDIGKIKIGQAAYVILDSYPDKKVSAKVNQIAYESTLVNNVNLYEIDVLPKTIPRFFRSGMSATVNFELERKENILILPGKAVRKRNGNAFVFTRKDNGSTPQQLEVSTGIEGQDLIEIISGLKEGAEVIIPNAALLKTVSQNSRRGPIRNPFSKQN